MSNHASSWRSGNEVPSCRWFSCGGAVAIIPLRVALDARHRGGVLRELTPGLSMGIEAIHRRAKLTSATSQFLAFAKQSLNDWVRAIERRMAEGDSLVDAAVRTANATDRRVRQANLDISPWGDRRV